MRLGEERHIPAKSIGIKEFLTVKIAAESSSPSCQGERRVRERYAEAIHVGWGTVRRFCNRYEVNESLYDGGARASREGVTGAWFRGRARIEGRRLQEMLPQVQEILVLLGIQMLALRRWTGTGDERGNRRIQGKNCDRVAFRWRRWSKKRV